MNSVKATPPCIQPQWFEFRAVSGNEKRDVLLDEAPCFQKRVDAFFGGQSSHEERVAPGVISVAGVGMNKIGFHSIRAGGTPP